MLNTQPFINYLESFSYFGIFVIGSLVGYLIPLPEEVFLLLVGYIAGIGIYNVYWGTFFAIIGVLARDNILFFLSKYKVSKIVDKVNRHLMKKHIGKTLFTLKFIVGLRIFSPFLAGSMKIKWRIFQFYNLLAVII